ncbi:hypothetical protein BG000_005906, partial [Podila horticola]
FVETQSAEELACNLVQRMDLHGISLHDVLRALFASNHPDVLKMVNYFYGRGGAAAMVKIWGTGRQQKDSVFVEAATGVVIARGATELNQLSEINHLRHSANAIDLDKVQDFKLKFIEQHPMKLQLPSLKVFMLMGLRSLMQSIDLPHSKLF